MLFEDLIKRYQVNKDILAVAPALATAIAISFDVGYFTGIDINYFNMFSLSEHLIFALQPAPFIFGITAMAALAIALWDAMAIRAFIKQLEEDAAGRRSQTKRKSWLDEWIPLMVLALSLAVQLYFRTFSLAFITAGAIIFVFFGNFFPEVVLSRRAILAYAAVVCSIGIFIYAYQLALRDLASKSEPHIVTLTEGEIRGQIIRSGERGVLFYVPASSQITLLKWDMAKSISSTKRP